MGFGIDYSRLPEHMQEGARRYIENGIPGGSFLHAVLSNNFVEAFAKADRINSAVMKTWAEWLYNECPLSAWGSEENVAEWCAHGGLNGFQEESHAQDTDAIR